jgi:hypothetical protein
MLHKIISHSFSVLCLRVAVSHSGHPDSLVRGIVICYAKSFHCFKLLFLFVTVPHSGHQDSLVRGIVICYTKSVGTPHGGGWYAPLWRGVVLGAEETHSCLFGSWPCGCMHSPLPIPLQHCKSSA